MTGIVPAYKLECEGLQVEFEVVSPIELVGGHSGERQALALDIQDLDKQIDACEEELKKLDSEIDRLTNHADGLDYTVAVASGLITGAIDSFFGEQIKEITDGFINKGLIKTAKDKKIKEEIHKAEEAARKKGKELTDDARNSIRRSVTEKFTVSDNKSEKSVLSTAIRYFETRNESPTDNLWNYKGTSITPKSHHLDDLTHHASLIGLVASIVTQFTRKADYFDASGKHQGIPITIDEKNDELFGKTVPSKIVCGTVNWFWHLASDVAGTSGKTAGGGMGVPGPLLSLIKGFSSLPIIKETKLSEFANFLFTNDGVRFDFREEVAQSIPVLMNELFVRTFYAIRRFMMEYCENKGFKGINWKNVLPFRNRTVIRMLTIATGTFTAFDLADAAIRSGGFNASCLMKINFVGVGRFAVAVVTDVSMGIKRNHLMNERIGVLSEQMKLLNAKVSYKCAEMYYAQADAFEAQEEMWIAAQNTEQTLYEVYEITAESVTYIADSLVEIQQSFENISEYREGIERNNPGLIEDLTNILKWGEK
ncbi:MAG: hypothetical protein IJD22_03635 [Clostridia bacterium]|nr:hypothetical protein [Clostridia bacterium]